MYSENECVICGKEVSMKNMKKHLINVHKVDINEFLEQYPNYPFGAKQWKKYYKSLEPKPIIQCEMCGEDHNGEFGSGRFCSQKCSRGFATKENREKINEKISDSLQGNTPWNKGRKSKVTKTGKPYKKRGSPSKETKEKRAKTFSKNAQLRKKQFFNDWLDGKVDGSEKAGLSRRIKGCLLEHNDNKCQKCGWGEVNEYSGNVPLEIHHVDGDASNNVVENIELLCPNCHALTKTYKNIGSRESSRKYRKKYYK